MRDSELIAAILAGDPGGRTALYDRYAAPLYEYCHAVLGKAGDPAGAVRDTFLVAVSRLSGLRDRDQLRPWLFALARNECQRRLRNAGGAGRAARRARVVDGAGVPELVAAALADLSPVDRDVIELNLRHGLARPDLAVVLGVSAQHAHELAMRATGLLENSLGDLLAIHTGRADCPELDAMLEGWDGRLTPLLHQRLSRHIKHCEACREPRDQALRTATLLGLLPAAELPAGLRHRVLKMMAGTTPEAADRRDLVAQRAEPFAATGFPVPLVLPGPARLRRRRILAAATAAAAAAVIIPLVLASGRPNGGVAPAEAKAAPSGSARVVTPASGATSRARGGGAQTGGSQGTNGRGSASAAGSATGGKAGTGTGAGGTGAGGGAVASASPAPTQPGVNPSPSANPTQPAMAGTLVASTRSVTLSAAGTGSFTLTAQGGPVSYSIMPGAGLLGNVSASPSSGSLAAGQSVTISVTSSSLVSLDGTLTVNPGGIAITVLLTLL